MSNNISKRRRKVSNILTKHKIDGDELLLSGDPEEHQSHSQEGRTLRCDYCCYKSSTLYTVCCTLKCGKKIKLGLGLDCKKDFMGESTKYKPSTGEGRPYKVECKTCENHIVASRRVVVASKQDNNWLINQELCEECDFRRNPLLVKVEHIRTVILNVMGDYKGLEGKRLCGWKNDTIKQGYDDWVSSGCSTRHWVMRDLEYAIKNYYNPKFSQFKWANKDIVFNFCKYVVLYPTIIEKGRKGRKGPVPTKPSYLHYITDTIGEFLIS